MERQSFRGGYAFAPWEHEPPDPAFTYAPGLTFLQDTGGEWAPYMLFSEESFFTSNGGVRWSTSSEGEGSLYAAYFGVLLDPRVALRSATAPEITGEETIDGRTHLIVSAGLDVGAILHEVPAEQPYVDITLRFPYPEGGDARELEKSGYEVFGSELQDSARWEAFKGPYHLSFVEEGDGVYASVIVQGASELESSAEQEIRAALVAYGADPDLMDGARVRSTMHETRETLRQQWQGIEARLWIDAETGLVRRMAFGLGPSAGEWVVGFWGYDDHVELQAPTDVMDARRADALDRITRINDDILHKALHHHEMQHGRYPDTLTPETVRDALEELGLAWPTNPFSGAPSRHAPDSAGDFHYSVDGNDLGNDYALLAYGWDAVLSNRYFQNRVSAGGQATPGTDIVEQELEDVRAVGFPVLWLGPESGASTQGGVTLPALTLTEAAACPPEPACIWPVRLAYGIPESGTRLILQGRSRSEGDISEGEQARIAGREATVLIKEEPLPFPGLSGWRATIWLPESVVRVAAVVREGGPDWNRFNSEAGLAGATRLLKELQ